MKLIDSNILVYAYDNTEKQKHEIALALLDKCWLRKENYALSVQNLSEFFVIITEKGKKMEKEQAKKIIKGIANFKGWTVFPITSQTVNLATDISTEFSIHYFDALIAAVMNENGLHEILTENDKDFNKIPWIKVTNPFK